MKNAYVFLADGFEEVEAITPVDVLRRAGIPVKTVSIKSSLQVTGAHGITVNADYIYSNSLITEASWLILPGGMPGAKNLYEFAPLAGLLKNQMESRTGKIAAICASPAVVLGQLGLLKGRVATCYPGFEDLLQGSEVRGEAVTVDDKFVLGNGPANALKWALGIVGVALGTRAAAKVGGDMLLYPQDKNKPEHIFG